MMSANSCAPPPGGVKSIQSKLPVALELSLLVSHCPTTRPACGLDGVPAGSLQAPIGNAQLIWADFCVAVAHALTALGVEATPRKLRSTCMNQVVMPPWDRAHIAYFAVAGLAAALVT